MSRFTLVLPAIFFLASAFLRVQLLIPSTQKTPSYTAIPAVEAAKSSRIR